MKTLEQIIQGLWYALVALIPIQTIYIVSQAQLGDTQGGVWQYGVMGLYVTDVIIVLLIVLNLFMWWRRCGMVRPSYVGVCVALVSVAVAESILAMYQVAMVDAPGSKWLGMSLHTAKNLGDSVVEVGLERWLRGYGTMPHPNILATFLALAWVTAVVQFLRAQARQSRLLWGAGSAILSGGLIATFSRGGWISALIAVFVIILGGWRYADRELRARWLRRSFFVLGISCVTAALFSALWWSPMSTRLGVGGWQRLEQRSINERTMSVKEGVSLWQARPWFGYGVGRATVAEYESEKAQGHMHPVYYYQPPHNLFLVILVETGLVGFALFLVVMGSLIWRLIKKIRASRSDEARSRHLLVLALLVGLLASGLFDHFLWTLHSGVMLWIIPLVLYLSREKA